MREKFLLTSPSTEARFGVMLDPTHGIVRVGGPTKFVTVLVDFLTAMELPIGTPRLTGHGYTSTYSVPVKTYDDMRRITETLHRHKMLDHIGGQTFVVHRVQKLGRIMR